MRKWISALLILCMLLTLSACGGAESAESPAASGGETKTAAEKEAAPTPTPEPEKCYIEKAAQVPTKKTEEGLGSYQLTKVGPLLSSMDRTTAYSYDEYGVATETVSFLDEEADDFLNTAENFDLFGYEEDERYEVVRDDAGELVSVTKPGGMSYSFMGGGKFSTVETAKFENGRIVTIEAVTEQNEDHVSTTEREYYANGALSRSTTTNEIVASLFGAYRFAEPLVDIAEYNEDGFCTLLHEESADDYNGVLIAEECRWEYDADNHPVSVSYARGEAQNVPIRDIAEIRMTAEMQYDGQGRMVSAVKTEGEVITEYSYTYDGDGRLVGVVRKTGDKTVESALEYDEGGRLIADHRTVNGAPGVDTLYEWEEGERGWFEGSLVSGDKDTSVFTSSSLTMYTDYFDENGNPTRETRYELLPSAATLEPVYTRREAEYEYGTIRVLVEVSPEELAALEEARKNLDNYYPVLSASYCGVPTPTSGGGERLDRVVVQYGDLSLDVVTEFVYGADGSLQEVKSYFGNSNVYAENDDAGETDEEGRLVRFQPASDMTMEYRYGDDPECYTMVRTSSGGSSETEHVLADEILETWIKKTPQELFPGSTVTLNEDGLMEKRESGTWSESYTYETELFPDGALKAVRRQHENGGTSLVLEFDQAGYLTYYGSPDYRYVRYYYS